MTDSVKVTLEPDGIIQADYGNIIVTLDGLREGIGKHRALAPGRKSKVIIIAESSSKIDQDVVNFGKSDEVASLTRAVAMVSDKKIGRIMMNLYLTVQKNPYPTRAFNDVESARAWLHSLD
ncbi:MAG: hypothetical protein ISR50_21335 [Alphaproteobacteria bacterium]|nr:hypothetical protein [Alphaproteobacteria bacterium]MBL6955186.1 hypothetical protein [Alphaproteobacteria bacterium]